MLKTGWVNIDEEISFIDTKRHFYMIYGTEVFLVMNLRLMNIEPICFVNNDVSCKSYTFSI